MWALNIFYEYTSQLVNILNTEKLRPQKQLIDKLCYRHTANLTKNNRGRLNLILYINLVPHLKISNQLVKDLPFFEIFTLQNLTVRLDIYIILFFTKPLLQTSEVAIYIQKSKSQSRESIRDSQGKTKKWIAAELELQKKEDPIPITLLLMETPFLPMMCA